MSRTRQQSSPRHPSCLSRACAHTREGVPIVPDIMAKVRAGAMACLVMRADAMKNRVQKKTSIQAYFCYTDHDQTRQKGSNS